MEAKKQSFFFTFLDKFEDYSVTILYLTMIVVIFLQVVFRFVIKSSLPWSEELARYIMAYAVFIGAAIAAKEGAHIGINVVVGALPRPFNKYLRIFALFISFIFSVLLVYLSLIIVSFLMKTGQKSPAMLIPIWIAYASLPFGAVLMSIRFLQSTFRQFKQEEGVS